MKDAESFSTQLKKAIEQSGKTRYQISLETGIAQSVLSRFMHDKGGVSIESIDLICKSIGARLVSAPRTKRRT